MISQDEELQRVAEKIAGAVIDFCACHRSFFMDELTSDVRSSMAGQGHMIAPDSPGRVLRLLRQKKVIAYRVLSRPDSLYEVLSVATHQDGVTA